MPSWVLVKKGDPIICHEGTQGTSCYPICQVLIIQKVNAHCYERLWSTTLEDGFCSLLCGSLSLCSKILGHVDTWSKTSSQLQLVCSRWNQLAWHHYSYSVNNEIKSEPCWFKTQEEFQGCEQNHNNIASYLHVLLALYIARGTNAFLTWFIYLCVCVHANVHQHERVDWVFKKLGMNIVLQEATILHLIFHNH